MEPIIQYLLQYRRDPEKPWQLYEALPTVDEASKRLQQSCGGGNANLGWRVVAVQELGNVIPPFIFSRDDSFEIKPVSTLIQATVYDQEVD